MRDDMPLIHVPKFEVDTVLNKVRNRCRRREPLIKIIQQKEKDIHYVWAKPRKPYKKRKILYKNLDSEKNKAQTRIGVNSFEEIQNETISNYYEIKALDSIPIKQRTVEQRKRLNLLKARCRSRAEKYLKGVVNDFPVVGKKREPYVKKHKRKHKSLFAFRKFNEFEVSYDKETQLFSVLKTSGFRAPKKSSDEEKNRPKRKYTLGRKTKLKKASRNSKIKNKELNNVSGSFEASNKASKKDSISISKSKPKIESKSSEESSKELRSVRRVFATGSDASKKGSVSIPKFKPKIELKNSESILPKASNQIILEDYDLYEFDNSEQENKTKVELKSSEGSSEKELDI